MHAPLLILMHQYVDVCNVGNWAMYCTYTAIHKSRDSLLLVYTVAIVIILRINKLRLAFINRVMIKISKYPVIYRQEYRRVYQVKQNIHIFVDNTEISQF